MTIEGSPAFDGTGCFAAVVLRQECVCIGLKSVRVRVRVRVRVCIGLKSVTWGADEEICYLRGWILGEYFLFW